MKARDISVGQTISICGTDYTRVQLDFADINLSDLANKLRQQDKVLLLTSDGYAKVICVEGFMEINNGQEA